jgi:DNA mismatch endonuclease (patch repair protein)
MTHSRPPAGPRIPRFEEGSAASARASASARGSSRKKDTQCEILLRRELYRLGLRYRIAFDGLPGRPDIVFPRERIAVFCDGDFWHGRNLQARIAKLAEGHNAPYWVAKIQGNVGRDRAHDERLGKEGWLVLRFWEKDILASPASIAQTIVTRITERRLQT